MVIPLIDTKNHLAVIFSAIEKMIYLKFKIHRHRYKPLEFLECKGVKSFVFMEILTFCSSILTLIVAKLYIFLSNILVDCIHVQIEMIK